MTAAQYRTAIKKLGLSQRAAAKFFGVNERTSRRWAKDGTSKWVGHILHEIIRRKIVIEPGQKFNWGAIFVDPSLRDFH